MNIKTRYNIIHSIIDTKPPTPEQIKLIDAMTQEWIKDDLIVEYNKAHKPGDAYWVTYSIEHHLCPECAQSGKCFNDQCFTDVEYGPYSFEEAKKALYLRNDSNQKYVFIFKLKRYEDRGLDYAGYDTAIFKRKRSKDGETYYDWNT